MEYYMSSSSQTLTAILPTDILGEVGNHMNWRALLRASQTNQLLRNIYSQDSLWEPLFKAYFPDDTTTITNYKQAFLTSYSAWLGNVISDYGLLQYASQELKKDKQFILNVVRHHGWALEFVDNVLKKDKDVVMAAVSQNGYSLLYADSSLKKDKDIVLDAVSKEGQALFHADDELKKDKDIVMAAVKKDGLAIQYADFILKKDKDIALAAVTQNGVVLDDCDDELQNDNDIVMAAITNDGIAYEFAGSRFQFDHTLRAIASILDDRQRTQAINDYRKKSNQSKLG
jgi:Domain of unknown function (DUF4116)